MSYPYQKELENMVASANSTTKANYNPFIVEVKDQSLNIQLRPIWAKTAFDAVKQCIAQNPFDWVQNCYTIPLTNS